MKWLLLINMKCHTIDRIIPNNWFPKNLQNKSYPLVENKINFSNFLVYFNFKLVRKLKDNVNIFQN